jgi:ribose transport system substrate-binding protein
MWRRELLAGIGLAAVLGAGAPAAAQDEQVTIGVSIPAATHGWTGGVNYHAEQAIQRLSEQHPNLKFQLVSASDAGKQVNDLEDLVSIHQIDALVILPFESAPLTGPVKRVADQGIFVTVVDRGLTEPGIEDLYVAGNNAEFGRVAGEYMAEKLGGEGKIVVLRGIPTVIDNQRVEAFQQAIEGTGVEILDMKHANWNRDEAFEVMQDFLSRFPEIDAVWASDDDMALGVIEAVRQAGREEDLWILGGAGMKQMVERVMNEDRLIPADVLYPPAMIATAIEVTALKYTANVPVQGSYILGSPLITPENAEQYYYPDSPF